MMTLVRLSYNDGDTTTKWYKTNGTMDLRLKELWAKSVTRQIGYMLDLWDSVEVKPEWLTREQIIDLRRKMS